MEALLVAVLAACTLPLTVRAGRGLWARARSVQRHQQALDTLAGITKGSDGPQEGAGGQTTTGAHYRPDNQAHVRVLGPGGEVIQGALPPPRPVARPNQTASSPLRRPSRSAPSAAALDAVNTSLSAKAEGTRLVRTGRRGPAARSLPGTAVPGSPSGPALRALPGQELPAAPTQGPPPTRPVPAIRPHVYYFDDLSPRPSGDGEAPTSDGAAAAAGTDRARRVAKHRDDPIADPAVADALVAALAASRGQPSPPRAPAAPDLANRAAGEARAAQTVPGGPAAHETETVASGPTPEPADGDVAAFVGPAPGPAAPGWTAPSGPVKGGGATRDLPSGRGARLALVAAAVALIAAAAAVAVTQLPSHRTAAPGKPVASPGSVPPKASSTTTTGTLPRPTTTAPPAPPKPAVLLSAAGGTATYQLTSRSASIVVTASGPCWIEVRVGSPLGQVVYEGTLEQGMKSSVTGPAWIRLGDPPYVTVTVDGTPMPVPGARQAVPLNLQFSLG